MLDGSYHESNNDNIINLFCAKTMKLIIKLWRANAKAVTFLCSAASQLNRQFQYVLIFSMFFHKPFFFRKNDLKCV